MALKTPISIRDTDGVLVPEGTKYSSVLVCGGTPGKENKMHYFNLVHENKVVAIIITTAEAMENFVRKSPAA